MIILKLTGVFEILVHFKIIILKRAAIWLIVFSCIMQISLSPRQDNGAW